MHALRKFGLYNRLALWRRRRQGVVGRCRQVIRTLPSAQAFATTVAEPVGGVQQYLVRHAQIVAQPPAIFDSQAQLLWPLSVQMQRQAYTADAIWKQLDHKQPRHLQGESLYAAIDGFSYYHWLTGVVPRLVVAKSAPYSANIANWIVTSNHKRHGSFQQETVKALGLNGQIVHLEKGSRLRCDSLRCMEEPSYAEHTRLKAWSLEALQEFGSIVTSGCDNQIDLPKRIFVRRHLARRRRLINEQEVERLLVEQYGFAVVDLETKSLAEQILLFRQVEAVAGMHGAGFTNLAFARVKPRVIEIASKEWPNRCFEYLTTQVGGSFGRVVGSALGKGFGADVTVDLRELKKTLAHLLS